MDSITIGIILAVLMLSLLAFGFWVSLSLMTVALVGVILYGSETYGLIFASSAWSSSTSWSLAALPLFIWMGEILFRTRLASDLFKGLTPWLGALPGRLLHVNILSCGLFAAVSGSSAATAATVGKMTLPELRARGYNERMSIATLAGSGTLGFLIPPSIILIVYGVAAEVSIARLFIAGALPGLLLIVLFMAYTMIWSWLNKGGVDNSPDVRHSWKERLVALRYLLPVLGLIGFVLGSIYGGFATTTEAAAVGVTGALILALLSGGLNRQTFFDSLMGAVRTSCMIALILVAAHFLTVAMAFLGIPRMLVGMIDALELSPMMLLVYLTILFIILGCFLDGISVVLLSTSIMLPMVAAAGIDLLWFGIYIVLVIEMAQITPPVGFNLFVLQSLTGKNILYVARAALPFFLLIGLAIVLISWFPEIVTALPAQMSR
ncbi:TRAP transporter large permease subunit [Natronospirillum operosum]|uniref:TRAP transporter large permease protein n=1 Tax=Natronospirillum operosum TaxID=2759953 RepID=A0A4Z0WA04_9GAMM|nr:TRAP transporter large permease subunit [Natronospirillum operosum]TGG94029.1 TRAP transporter large permease subunit [Natronospirillum operosum]